MINQELPPEARQQQEEIRRAGDLLLLVHETPRRQPQRHGAPAASSLKIYEEMRLSAEGLKRKEIAISPRRSRPRSVSYEQRNVERDEEGAGVECLVG